MLRVLKLLALIGRRRSPRVADASFPFASLRIGDKISAVISNKVVAIVAGMVIAAALLSAVESPSRQITAAKRVASLCAPPPVNESALSALWVGAELSASCGADAASVGPKPGCSLRFASVNGVAVFGGASAFEGLRAEDVDVVRVAVRGCSASAVFDNSEQARSDAVVNVIQVSRQSRPLTPRDVIYYRPACLRFVRHRC